MNRNVLVFRLPYVRIKGHVHAILLVLTLVCIMLCKSVCCVRGGFSDIQTICHHSGLGKYSDIHITYLT